MRSRGPSWRGRRGLAAIVHLLRVAAGIGLGAIWSMLLWPELRAHELLSWEWDQRFLLTILGFVVIGLVAFYRSRDKEASHAARPH